MSETPYATGSFSPCSSDGMVLAPTQDVLLVPYFRSGVLHGLSDAHSLDPVGSIECRGGGIHSCNEDAEEVSRSTITWDGPSLPRVVPLPPSA